MTDWKKDIIELPDEALPTLEDLNDFKGDLRLFVEIVGDMRIALRVAQVLGSTPLRLTGARKLVLRHRDHCLRRDYDQGDISQIELARRYGVGDRQVANILKTPEPGGPDPRQRKMF